MDEVKRHLAAQARKQERIAAEFDEAICEYQNSVVYAKEQASIARAKVAEFRMLLAHYGSTVEEVEATPAEEAKP